MESEAELMGWGFRNGPRQTVPATKVKRTELEKLAGEVERIFLGMPEGHQLQVSDTVKAMLQTAVGLQVLPDELATVIGKLVLRLFSELHLPWKHKPSAEQLIGQIARGAPLLLERLGTSEAGLLQVVK